MIAYSAENSGVTTGFTGATLPIIGFATSGTPRYSYTLEGTATLTFTANATGTGGRVIGDVWEINETKTLTDVDQTSFTS